MIEQLQLLSAADVAKACGISREAFRKMRARNEGPRTIQIGRTVVVTLRDFVDWLAEQLVKATRPRWLRRLRV
jgi:predicted DNA-binding transcriptional regulator AlpA